MIVNKNLLSEGFPLRVISPDFDSQLTDTLIELNHLRKLKLGGSTAPWVFFQLKTIFHILESVGSARIEGNRTTISEYIERKIEHEERSDERFSEIANVKLGSDESFYNLMIYGVFTDLSVAIKRDLQRYCHP